MRILLIGMTGRVGRHVLERAIADGHDVTALVRDTSRVAARSGLAVRMGDVADRSSVGVP